MTNHHSNDTNLAGDQKQSIFFLSLLSETRKWSHNALIHLILRFHTFAHTSTNLWGFFTSCAGARNIQEVKRNNTWGKFFVASTLLSMDKTNAAVFPVPDCDWAIILFGLNIKPKEANIYTTATSYSPRHLPRCCALMWREASCASMSLKTTLYTAQLGPCSLVDSTIDRFWVKGQAPVQKLDSTIHRINH